MARAGHGYILFFLNNTHAHFTHPFHTPRTHALLYSQCPSSPPPTASPRVRFGTSRDRCVKARLLLPPSQLFALPPSLPPYRKHANHKNLPTTISFHFITRHARHPKHAHDPFHPIPSHPITCLGGLSTKQGRPHMHARPAPRLPDRADAHPLFSVPTTTSQASTSTGTSTSKAGQHTGRHLIRHRLGADRVIR